MLLVFYGKGKGKSTAAYGTAIRALGRGWKVVIALFMKSWDSGEVLFFRRSKLPVRIFVLGTEEFVQPGAYDSIVASENMARAYAFLTYVLPRTLRSFKPKLVVFDELGLATHMGIVDEGVVVRALRRFSGSREVHAIVTGRYVPSTIKSLADLVSEVREVKHYFRKGFVNLEGLDY